jgi:hypothetical protein
MVKNSQIVVDMIVPYPKGPRQFDYFSIELVIIIFIFGSFRHFAQTAYNELGQRLYRRRDLNRPFEKAHAIGVHGRDPGKAKEEGKSRAKNGCVDPEVSFEG